MCFAFSLIFSIFAAKNNTFPIRETKKQQTAKGLLLKIGVFPISFMGCFFLYPYLNGFILPSIRFPIFR